MRRGDTGWLRSGEGGRLHTFRRYIKKKYVEKFLCVIHFPAKKRKSMKTSPNKCRNGRKPKNSLWKPLRNYGKIVSNRVVTITYEGESLLWLLR